MRVRWAKYESHPPRGGAGEEGAAQPRRFPTDPGSHSAPQRRAPALPPVDQKKRAPRRGAALVTVLLAGLIAALMVDAKIRSSHRLAAAVPSTSTATTPSFLRRDSLHAVTAPAIASKIRHSPEPGPLGSVGVVGPARLNSVAEQVLDEAVDLIGDYRLPASIRMQASRCGTFSGPSYDSKAQQIDLCSEFIEQRYSRAMREGDGRALEQARDFARFAVAHELGHAMIDLFHLPVLGKSEDAADQFAAMMFLSHNRPNPVLAAAIAFEQAARNAQLDREALGDEHALDGQREANLVCWLYASDSATFASVAHILPEQRRANCREEYVGVVEAWKRLMAPHRRTE
ncbi:MAG TPA: DUF4344 domain-containing metallopeptidase [Gemmatimonadaceae bacterium]